MAGRPLRRLRLLQRLNPLVAWDDASGATSKTAEEPFVPLVQAGAEQKYAAVYNRIGLPLVVTLASPYEPANKTRARASALSRQMNAIVLLVSIRRRRSKSFYADQSQKRGESTRISPFTPFVVLHRLGDSLLDLSFPDRNLGEGAEGLYAPPPPELERARGLIRQMDAAAREAFRIPDDEMLNSRLLSRGVDTAAGRMGVLRKDYISDLFAKWLITGRVAYDPENPPPANDEERAFRHMVAEYAPRLFEIWYTYLAQNVPGVYVL